MVTDETKPPKRYSESSIVQAMKKAEIGRPSTYVSTVSKLSARGYVEVEGSSLHPTEAGRMMWMDVVPFYNEQEESGGLFTPHFPSKMEESTVLSAGMKSGMDSYSNLDQCTTGL